MIRTLPSTSWRNWLRRKRGHDAVTGKWLVVPGNSGGRALLNVSFFFTVLLGGILVTPLAQESPDPRISRLLEQSRQALQLDQPAQLREHSKAILGRALAKLGEIALAFADYSAAERAFREGLESEASLIPSLQGLSAVYLATRRYQEGVEVCRRTLELDPNHGDARYLLAMFHFMLDQLEPAKVQLADLYQSDPDNRSVAYSLALCHIKLDEKPQGGAILRTLEEGSEPSAELYLMLGKAYQEAQQLEEAMRTLSRALSFNSNTAGANYQLALTYLLDQGRTAFPLAKLHLELELSQDPDSYYPNYLLAVIHFHERNFHKAVPYLEKAISADPDNPDPHLYLGQSRLESAAVDQAVVALKKSIELTRDPARNDFQLARTYYSLGSAFRRAGQTTKALASLQSAQQLMKQGHLDRIRQGSAVESGPQSDFRPDEFTNSRLALIPRLEPPDPKTTAVLETRASFYRRAVAFAYQNLAALEARESRFARAAAQFQKASDWDPDLPDLAYNLAVASLQAGRSLESLGPAKEALRAKPNDPDTHQLMHYLARSLLENELVGPAAETIDLIEESAGKTGETLVLRGRVLSLQEDHESALSLFDQALALNPLQSSASYQKALLLISGQRTREALPLLARVIQLQPNHAGACFELGKLQLDQGQLIPAVANLEFAAARKPSAEAYQQLARAYSQLGRSEAAEKALERARELKVEPRP